MLAVEVAVGLDEPVLLHTAGMPITQELRHLAEPAGTSSQLFSVMLMSAFRGQTTLNRAPFQFS